MFQYLEKSRFFNSMIITLIGSYIEKTFPYKFLNNNLFFLNNFLHKNVEEFEPIALEEMDRVLMSVSSATCILVLYPLWLVSASWKVICT